MNTRREIGGEARVRGAVKVFSRLSTAKRSALLVAELLILVGQFLPLKSVLIIHKAEVPSFVRPVLGTNPTIAAVVLFLAGLLFFFAGKHVTSAPQFAPARKGNFFVAPASLVFASFLAPLMAIQVVSFLIVVSVFSIFKRFRKDNLGASTPELALLKRLEEYSMIVTALAALFSMVFWPPSLGLYGVLAAAVFLNKAQRELRPFVATLVRL